MSLKVLISGASVAGPTLAYWLARSGWHVTLLERAAGPRQGGQAIDVRGSAVDVLKKMDLATRARELRTRMKGVSAIDADGVEVWRSEERTFSGGRFDSGDIEILRDDLSHLLSGSLGDGVERMWGDTIQAIEGRAGDVAVSFEKAEPAHFDMVIGADGLYSNVRQLIFGTPAGVIESLGTGLAVFTAPNSIDLQDWQIAHREGAGGFLVYTARENKELRVALGFPLEAADEGRLSIEDQKQLVAMRCAHMRWHVPQLLAAMWEAPDFYFGAVAQVHLTKWSKGRVALVGDAAYCPSPFSGQGTSLAIVGAYVLAAELAKTPGDHGRAFSRYQQRMKHYVDLNQALARKDRGDPEADSLLDQAKNAINLDGE